MKKLLTGLFATAIICSGATANVVACDNTNESSIDASIVKKNENLSLSLFTNIFGSYQTPTVDGSGHIDLNVIKVDASNKVDASKMFDISIGGGKKTVFNAKAKPTTNSTLVLIGNEEKQTLSDVYNFFSISIYFVNATKTAKNTLVWDYAKAVKANNVYAFYVKIPKFDISRLSFPNSRQIVNDIKHVSPKDIEEIEMRTNGIVKNLLALAWPGMKIEANKDYKISFPSDADFEANKNMKAKIVASRQLSGSNIIALSFSQEKYNIDHLNLQLNTYQYCVNDVTNVTAHDIAGVHKAAEKIVKDHMDIVYPGLIEGTDYFIKYTNDTNTDYSGINMPITVSVSFDSKFQNSRSFNYQLYESDQDKVSGVIASIDGYIPDLCIYVPNLGNTIDAKLDSLYKYYLNEIIFTPIYAQGLFDATEGLGNDYTVSINDYEIGGSTSRSYIFHVTGLNGPEPTKARVQGSSRQYLTFAEA